ncbi:MAG: hypothetical protein M3Q07_12190 [Pseudobdellovibrionaceae bacterium]|nr:hypothetical protein [Pseudobdellovibrionaceae bacterium]
MTILDLFLRLDGSEKLTRAAVVASKFPAPSNMSQNRLGRLLAKKDGSWEAALSFGAVALGVMFLA